MENNQKIEEMTGGNLQSSSFDKKKTNYIFYYLICACIAVISNIILKYN